MFCLVFTRLIHISIVCFNSHLQEIVLQLHTGEVLASSSALELPRIPSIDRQLRTGETNITIDKDNIATVTKQ